MDKKAVASTLRAKLGGCFVYLHLVTCLLAPVHAVGIHAPLHSHTDETQPVVVSAHGHATACSSAISIRDNRLPVTIYKTTARIDWSKVINPKMRGVAHSKRGVIRGMSPRSGQRLCAALGDAPREWGVMATLTFRERVMDGRAALRRFQRSVPQLHDGRYHYAWIREYQDRGAVHYHYLWDKTILTDPPGITSHNMRAIQSRGHKRVIIEGGFADSIVEAWISAVGDTSDEFIAFQRGGIVQAWEGVNGAARYFGSYLAKPEQKTLPEDAECTGRWWFICPQAAPVPIGKAFATRWHLERPLSVLFDKEPLMDHLAKDLPPFIPRWGDKPPSYNPPTL